MNILNFDFGLRFIDSRLPVYVSKFLEEFFDRPKRLHRNEVEIWKFQVIRYSREKLAETNVKWVFRATRAQGSL